jgi:predicted GNAT family acetyltransferase
MSNVIENLTVVHNEGASRFEAEIEGQLAVVDYERRGNIMYFTHTGTPVAHRGQGIACEVTRVALEYAKAAELQVVPLCSFTVTYLRRHPEYQRLVRN